MSCRFHPFIGILVLGSVCYLPSATSQTVQATKDSAKKTPSRTSTHTAKPAAASEVSKQDLDQIKRTIADQIQQEQKRFDALEQQNQLLGQELKATQQKLAEAEQKINGMTTTEVPQIANLQTAVAAVKSEQAVTTAFVAQQKKLQPERDQPLALHYKGVTITPGGFISAAALYRSHAENADMNTSWSGIPLSSQVMTHLTEFRGSARQTMISLRANGKAGSTTLTGYFETDFLGAGSGASEVQSNGYSNRIRQLWGRAQFSSGWTFSAGQMWSLVMTNRTGIENLTEFSTPLIDGSQFIANDYARQTAFRVSKTFAAGKVTGAFAVENAATVGVTPANVPSSVTNLLSGLSTTGTGALGNTTYSTNVAPDLIAKVAFDPGFGHYEIKAIGRTFRDRIDSTATTAGHNNTRLGGAIGGAAEIPVFSKKSTFIAEGMWGAIGRYGATSTDVVVEPNGQLSVEKSVHVLTGIETHPTPKIDWYAFVSDEYLPRNYGYGISSIVNTGCFVEAVASSSTAPSCSPSTRNVEGGTTGFWYRPYKGAGGTVQYGVNYAYIVKNTWSGVGGAPRAVENVVETSFRYYLP